MLTTHTHQPAKKSRLLPSSLRLLSSPPAPLPLALGTGRGTLGDGRVPGNSVDWPADSVWGALHLLGSGLLHLQAQEPGLCPGWAGAALGANPVLSPSFFLTGDVCTLSCLCQNYELLSVPFSFLLDVLLFELKPDG